MSAVTGREGVLLTEVSRIAGQIAGPHADEVDRAARFPHEAINALRECGALAALIPERLGGGGESVETVAEACYELGRHCSATAMIFAMHQIMVATIARHPEAGWFEDYLREVAGDGRLVASVTSEIGTGGDMGRSIAPVRAGRDGWLELEKQAPTVSYGAQADDLLITARRSEDAAENDQVLVLSRASEADLEPAGSWDTLGMRGTCSPGFTVRARFRPEQIMETPFSLTMSESMVPLSHVLWSFVWLGIATDAFERGRAFVRASARRAPGTPVPAGARLAQIMAELTTLRSDVHSALGEFVALSEEPGREKLSTMRAVLRFNNLKLAASEQAPKIVTGVLETIGIMAYKNDSPFGVGRHLRDLHSARLMVANERIRATNANLLLIAKEI